MNLLLTRKWYFPQCVIGEMFVDFHRECYTLEDPERKEKIPGKTAIPKGLYRVVIDWSNRFQRPMPHILDVPNFEGIRIHPGNTEADTEGCILVGMERGDGRISNSRIAFNRLFTKIDQAQSLNEIITLEVV